jgi:glucokinase
MVGAIDIGGTKIAVGMLDEEGHLLARLECPTESQRGFADGLARIKTMVDQASSAVGAKATGIGIGCTGPVNPFTGHIEKAALLPGWEGADIVGELSRIFEIPVAIENDADAVALAEATWGSGKNKSSMICVTVGTGIGGGIVLDGKLYRGIGETHPELGHQIIDASGPLCYCGVRGCWEVLAAGPAMVEWFKKKAQPDDPCLPELSAKHIFEMARAGHQLACSVVQREAHYLTLGLVNLITLFAPEVIVLAGGVMKGAVLLGDIEAEMRRSLLLVPFEKTELRASSLGLDAGLSGAAQVWYHRFQKSKKLA